MTTINKGDDYLNQIKSKYILEHIMKHTEEMKFLEVIRYNKSLQNKLNITLNDYKELALIELEILFEPEKTPPFNFIYQTKKNDFNFQNGLFSQGRHHNLFGNILDGSLC